MTIAEVDLVPQDQHGSYPACVGLVPASFGKRVGAVALDIVVFVVGYLLAIWAMVQGSTGWAIAILSLLVVANMVALFGYATRFGGLLVGTRHVDTATGEVSRSRALGKYALVALTGPPTLGIAPIIVNLTTLSKPTNRTAFDRAAGVMVVDVKQSPTPSESEAEIDGERSVAVLAPVTLDALPVAEQGSADRKAVAKHAEPLPRSSASPAKVKPTRSEVGSTPGAGASSSGFISSTPFSGRTSQARTAGPPPAAPERRPVIREMRSVEASVQSKPTPADDGEIVDQTIIDPGVFDSDSVRRIILDGADTIEVTAPVVFGRNPAAPPSLPEARLYPVVDTDRGISKTHVAFGSNDNGVWVMDLDSTNGTRLVGSSAAEHVPAGEQTPVPDGATVLFGSHEVRVL